MNGTELHQDGVRHERTLESVGSDPEIEELRNRLDNATDPTERARISQEIGIKLRKVLTQEPNDALTVFRQRVASKIEEQKPREGQPGFSKTLAAVNPEELTNQDRQMFERLEERSLTQDEFHRYGKTLPMNDTSRDRFKDYMANILTGQIIERDNAQGGING